MFLCSLYINIKSASGEVWYYRLTFFLLRLEFFLTQLYMSSFYSAFFEINKQTKSLFLFLGGRYYFILRVAVVSCVSSFKAFPVLPSNTLFLRQIPVLFKNTQSCLDNLS